LRTFKGFAAGLLVHVSVTADRLSLESGLNGFRAIGFHIPTKPKGLATRQARGNDEQEYS
jgi:hypothetical protein